MGQDATGVSRCPKCGSESVRVFVHVGDESLCMDCARPVLTARFADRTFWDSLCECVRSGFVTVGPHMEWVRDDEGGHGFVCVYAEGVTARLTVTSREAWEQVAEAVRAATGKPPVVVETGPAGRSPGRGLD